MTRAVASVNHVVSSVMSLGYWGVALPPVVVSRLIGFTIQWSELPPVTPLAKPSALPTTPTALAICARLASAAKAKNFMVNIKDNTKRETKVNRME